MTSSSQSAPCCSKVRVKSFSYLLHFASLLVLIACVYCIIVLFRDLRRLEALVKERALLGEPQKITSTGASTRVRRQSHNDLDVYETAALGNYDDYNDDRLARESSGKRTVAADSDLRVNLSGSKLTIVTKDDERLLLQTADGSPWALLPSVTRIPLSTLEDFCLTTHQYCANKNQVIRPVPSRAGGQGTDCDGRCSNRRSNSEIPRDTGSQESLSEDRNTVQPPPNLHQHTPKTLDSSGRLATSNEALSNHLYNSEHIVRGQTTAAFVPLEQQTASPKRRKGLGRKKRKRERCFIEHISNPFMMGHRIIYFGSWMQDASPRADFDADKRWVTEHISANLLQEYASAHDLKKGGSHGDTPVRIRDLPHMYDGTNHVMYNGSFIYKKNGSPVIIRFDLASKNYTETRIPGAAYNNADYLYSDESHNYFDIAIDENGLWVLFHYEKSNTLSVARLHPKTMRLIRVWNLTRFDHTKIGDTWVACGVMYVLDSRKAHNTTVSVAYDLFRHRSATVNIPWRNSYNMTTMVAYNPRIKRLHIYDGGFLLEKNLLMAFPGKPGDPGHYA